MSNNQENATALVPPPQASIGAAYGFGWERMLKFFLDLFLITIIVTVIWIPLGMINSLDGALTPGRAILELFALAYWFLLFNPIDYGAAFVFLKAVRGESFEVKDMFFAFQNYWNVVLAELLTTAIVCIGLFLLIIPGIIFACKLAFVKYLVLDRGMDPVQAVKESWRMTKGHAWKIFFIGLLAIPIAIAGLICCLVGILPATMWIRCSFASIYYAVCALEEETV
jgi:uncharacterized membrane protein